MSVLGKLRTAQGGMVLFHCPGCKHAHAVRIVPDGGKPCWTSNGGLGLPRFCGRLRGLAEQDLGYGFWAVLLFVDEG